MTPKRIGIFWDTQNLSQGRRKSNIRALLEWARQFGAIETSAAFVGENSTNGNHDFEVALKLSGVEHVVTVPAKQINNSSVKCNVDVTMAFIMGQLIERHRIDTVILCTGDSDFVPPVRTLCMQGRRVILVGPDNHTAAELIVASNNFCPATTVPGFVTPNGAEQEAA